MTSWAATLPLPFPGAVVAVPPGITVDPAGAVLGVANRVGPGAHAEWKANHEAVSRALVAGPVLAGAR